MSDQASAPAPGSADTRARSAQRQAGAGLILALGAGALLAVWVASGSSPPDGLDGAVTEVTRGWADPLGWPVRAAHILGMATSPVRSALAAAVIVVILLATRHRAAAAMLAVSGLVGLAVSEIIKVAMGRSRPPGAAQFEPDLEKSFPSGHAMVGIYLYLATGLVLIHLGRHHGTRWMVVTGQALVVLGPCIGLSRIVLGVHWPSDILAGWAFGSAVLLASALLLWMPLHRGWNPCEPPAVATPPAPPAAGAMPAPPAR